MKKISFYEYISTNVPSDAHFVINKFGSYRRARNPQELEFQLKNFVKNYGQNGLDALAEIHPDKKLLELNCESCKNTSHSNFNSKGAEDYENNLPTRFVNANGESTIDKLRTDQIKMSQFMIFGGMTLVAIAIILRKI